MKLYLKEREDFSGLLESDEEEEDLLPPSAPAQDENHDFQQARSPPTLASDALTLKSEFEAFSDGF